MYGLVVRLVVVQALKRRVRHRRQVVDDAGGVAQGEEGDGVLGYGLEEEGRCGSGSVIREA